MYCVAVTGVTGGEVALDDDLRAFIARGWANIGAPLAVGFGMRSPAQAAAVGEIVDGVMIASQLIRLAEQALDLTAARRSIDSFAAQVAPALGASPTAV